MGTVDPDDSARHAVVSACAQLVGDVIVAVFGRPDVKMALRTTLGSALPAPDADNTGLLTKKQLGRAIGKSVASIDRFDREGAPHAFVGDTKRYRLAAYTTWLAARGRKPTTAPRRARDEVDISDVIATNGLRSAEPGR
jgi:hypothetical protein